MSEAFRNLTMDAFSFEERGAMGIREAGEVRTYFLRGERADRSGQYGGELGRLADS